MNYQREAILLLLTIGIIVRVWHWSVNHKKERLAKTTAPAISTQLLDEKPVAAREEVVLTDHKKPASLSPVTEDRILFPVEGRSRKHVISFFGDPRQGGARLHQGVDIAAPRGTRVLAALDGVIERVKTGGAGGKQVWLKADNGWMFYYGHLHEQLVEEGQKVKAGAALGTVGNTGNASKASPHLHFEIHLEKDEVVNPLPYLSVVGP